MNAITVIFLVCYAPLWFAAVRYDTQMFQQNSYRMSRYARWYRRGNDWVRATAIAALAAASMLPFVSQTEFCGVAALVMLIAAWRELRTVYKLPIVYTMRVRRLFITAALLTAAAIAAALAFAPRYMPATALGLLVFPIVMSAANLLNRPVEAAVARWYYNDARRILRSMPDLIVIGVTGSFGKTSTKHYLYRILSEKYDVLMTPGNFNTTLGVIRTVREHLKPHHRVFIVEMGAKQRGDIREICDLVRPSIGIVTAVGEMHLETFRTVENILRTKFELIDSLPADGFGVVNLDSAPIAANAATYRCPVASYAVDNAAADYRAVNIAYSPVETTFDIARGDQTRTHYTTRLAGRGNILNLLAAIAVADRLGVSEAMQKRAVRQIEQIEHRLSVKRTAGGIAIIDDAYNSNPAGAKMALEVLREFRTDGGRRIVVTPGFVELGARQYELNRELGRDIAQACDMVVIVNLTNRDAIAEGLADKAFPDDKIRKVASFAEASNYLADRLRAGDAVLYENDLPDSFK